MEREAMKVVVTSQNQRGAHRHFRRVTQIPVHLTGGLGCYLVEIRQNRPPCGMLQDRLVF